VFDGLLPATTTWATGPSTATVDDLYADEAAAVRGAVPSRIAEFAAGRVAARRALAALGVDPVAVPVGARRMPSWPPGVVGSITHCAGLVAAAVGRVAEWWALGIDAEPAVALEADVRDVVTTPVERSRMTEPLDATVVFCAKEAFYKCWSALDGAVLEFHDVEVTFDGPSFVALPAGGDPWPGRWAVRDGFVLAAAWWAAGTPRAVGTTKSARGGPPTAP
jgi:4'-phosphopantetheinyl transferase EntD